MYFPEYKKEFQNLDGPGPGVYKFEKFNSTFDSDTKKRQGVTIPKVSTDYSTMYLCKRDDLLMAVVYRNEEG